MKMRRFSTTSSSCELFNCFAEEEDVDNERLEVDAEIPMDDVTEEEDNNEEWHDKLMDESSDSMMEQESSLDFEEEETVLESLQQSSLPESIPTQAWRDFKIVGDNIDKTVHRSFQRIHSASSSLHYFHSFAVLDRIDFSGLSDDPDSKPISFQELLPTPTDISDLKNTFTTLIRR